MGRWPELCSTHEIVEDSAFTTGGAAALVGSGPLTLCERGPASVVFCWTLSAPLSNALLPERSGRQTPHDRRPASLRERPSCRRPVLRSLRLVVRSHFEDSVVFKFKSVSCTSRAMLSAVRTADGSRRTAKKRRSAVRCPRSLLGKAQSMVKLTLVNRGRRLESLIVRRARSRSGRGSPARCCRGKSRRWLRPGRRRPRTGHQSTR